MRSRIPHLTPLALFASLLLAAGARTAAAAAADPMTADAPLALRLSSELLPASLARLHGGAPLAGTGASDVVGESAEPAALASPLPGSEATTGGNLQPALTLVAEVPGTPPPAPPGDGAVPSAGEPPAPPAPAPGAGSDPLEGPIREGLAARSEGHYALARERFNAALAGDPARPDVLHMLGMTDAYDKSWQAAMDHLGAAQALVPNDVDIALDRARVLSWSGHIPDASAIVDGVLAEHPEDGEAWDLRARLAWYLSQPVEAEAAARKAVQIDPLSTDFKLMLAQTLAAQERYPEAADLAREIAPLRPHDPDVAALLQAEVDNRPRPWRVDLALSHSSFERIPLQDWRGISVQVNRQWSKQDTVYARVDAAERFGQHNTSLTVGDSHTFRSGFGGYAEFTSTPGATFFPDWRLGGGLEYRIRGDEQPVGATFLSVDGAMAHYNTGTSYGLSPGVIQYFWGGQGWISLHLANSIDAQGHYLNGWGIRGDLLPAPNWNVHAGYSRAPESDYEITGGIISVVRDFTLGTSWQVTPDVSLRLDYLREDRVRSYIRHEVILGGSWRF